MAKVSIIQEGYAFTNEEGVMKANASCTLIQTPENIIIVDTLTPWDGPLILKKLEELHIQPSDITYVISTHGHSDHNGNNNLFTKAKKHIAGFCVSNMDSYFIHPFECGEPFIIDEFVRVIPTPGHTADDVSVEIKVSDSNKGMEVIVAAGDLFESEDDILKPELWTGNSYQPNVQVQHRLRVLKMAQQIIPGHGPMFRVKDNYIEAAENLDKKYLNTIKE